MMRFFGLVLAVVSMVQTADAALLSAWRFEGNASGSSTSGTPGDFMNNGVDPNSATHGIPGGVQNVSGEGRWRTGTNIVNDSNNYSATKFNSFSYSAASALSGITELKFSGRRTNGNTGPAIVFANVRYSIDGGPEVTLGTKQFTTHSSMSPFAFTTSISLLAGQVIDFRFYWARQGNATTAELDNIELLGDSQNVPEPASLAIFGLLGAGAVLRRMRRKA
jgi:hypothetical protein